MPNILIIDDDESICETLRLIFEKPGFNVDVVHTGMEGIRKSNEKVYNVALIDVRLPDMRGIEVLTKLQETVPKMVKIIITGYASLDNAIEALNNGADAFIRKPFKPEELVLTVKKNLEDQLESLKMTQERISDFVKDRVKALESEPKKK